MRIWKFDENCCDFAPAQAKSITADPEGIYLVADGDQLVLNEGGSLRSIPHDETLIAVAGQRFERERFDAILCPTPICSLGNSRRDRSPFCRTK